MIFIEVVFDVATETRDDVVELVRRTTEASHHDAGCVIYRFGSDLEVPNRFVLTELWESEEDLKAHFAELPDGGSFISSRAWEGPLNPYSPPDRGL
jgi:quinol monooxygenase YgiN